MRVPYASRILSQQRYTEYPNPENPHDTPLPRFHPRRHV